MYIEQTRNGIPSAFVWLARRSQIPGPMKRAEPVKPGDGHSLPAAFPPAQEVAVKTRWSVLPSGACVLSTALDEGVRAIPVQEIRRPRLRVVVYDETSDAPRTAANAADEAGAGSNATLRGSNDPDRLIIDGIESRLCADDRARAEEDHPKAALGLRSE